MRTNIVSDRAEQFPLAGAVTKALIPYPTTWVGFTLTFAAKRKILDIAPVVKKDSAAIGGIALGAPSFYTVQILSGDTSGFTVTELLEYAVTLVEPDGTRTVVARGTWKVEIGADT